LTSAFLTEVSVNYKITTGDVRKVDVCCLHRGENVYGDILISNTKLKNLALENIDNRFIKHWIIAGILI
jgi:hypothetical protein